MGLLYNGPFLNISFEKENNRFVQYWTSCPKNISTFKKEMLIYTSLYKIHKPSQTLWLQENFTLKVDSKTNSWIETHVNIPCLEYGNKKLAFVVSKDILAHLNVINAFEEIDSIIKSQTKHFSSEKEAREWLDGKFQNKVKATEPNIYFEGVDENGKAILKIDASENFIDTIKAFKTIENQYSKNGLLLLKNKTVIKFNSILYIKSDAHYVEIFIEDKQRPIIERSSLSSFLKKLPETHFLRIHKSYIVNLNKVKTINATQLMLYNGVWLTISRTYKPLLQSILLKK